MPVHPPVGSVQLPRRRVQPRRLLPAGLGGPIQFESARFPAAANSRVLWKRLGCKPSHCPGSRDIRAVGAGMQRLCSQRGKISRPSRFGMGGRLNGQRSGELGRSSFVGCILVVGKPHLFYRLSPPGKIKSRFLRRILTGVRGRRIFRGTRSATSGIGRRRTSGALRARTGE